MVLPSDTRIPTRRKRVLRTRGEKNEGPPFSPSSDVPASQHKRKEAKNAAA